MWFPGFAGFYGFVGLLVVSVGDLGIDAGFT